MPRHLRAWALRACAGALLVGVGVSLTSCGGSSGAASPPTAAPAPTPVSTTVAVAPTAVAPTAVATPAPIPRDKPVAVVAGQAISGAAYADLVAQDRIAAAVQAQQQGSAPPDERTLRAQALTAIVDTAVVNYYAQQHGITATAQEVQRAYDTAGLQIEQQAQQAGQTVTFTAVLKQYGYTPASFKIALRNQIVGSKVEQHLAPPGRIDAVRARHILLGAPLSQTAASTPTVTAKPDAYYKAEAEAIYQQLKKDPSQFARLARQKSIDTQSGAQGGELGWFVRGMMVPPFEKAAFSLPVGRISAPVKSQYGYHIIQVEAHQKIPFTMLPSSAAQVPAVATLVQRQQTQFQHWLTAERARDHVRILYHP